MNLPQFFKNKQLISIILITIFLLFLIGYSSTQTGTTSMFEDWIGKVLTPVQGVMYQVSGSIYDFFTSFHTKKELAEENRILKEKVEELESIDREAGNLEQENKRLRELLEFKDDNKSHPVAAARVVGKNPGNWFNVFVINKGTNDGIDVDMAVVNKDGLVGRVVEAGNDFSKVLTIIDARSSVSGVIERTRDNGVVRGNNFLDAGDGLCKMVYLPIESDIVVGDKVITSGIGGIIPKGIVIGEIQEIVKEQDELLKYAILKPEVDFLRIEEVLVVKSEIPKIDAIE
ncbi:MAG: rod shape-determining protein MreC [Clostridia bacterium]|nr:rod shape-determining protein MreC [Clostridia bacterium]